MRTALLSSAFALFFAVSGFSQHIEKIVFDTKDTANGYYLAIRPLSNQIKGVVVLLNSFSAPEQILPETKLHNVAFVNELLTIAVSMNQKVILDASSLERLNTIFQHVVNKYKVDMSQFVLAGYDFAGPIALRYCELTQEQPSQFQIHPKAVIAIDSPIDIFALWKWCERQIKRNSAGAGDARYLLDLMTRENGTIYDKKELYKKLTPFYTEEEAIGNEQFLKNIPVRLYYDTDIEWHLKSRGNSFYDTNIPQGSELISRLLAQGNTHAEFVTAKHPGMNSRGMRSTNSLSIVDEVDCIHWIKNQLDIFDAHTGIPTYYLSVPKGWNIERFPIPIEFAPQITYSGVEDVRFAPGWGDAKSEQYWSYAYLWWIKGKPKIDANILTQDLKAYYTGLVGRNILRRKIPADKIVDTNTTLKQIKTESNDIGTYKGTIRMLDYMEQKPILLNCIIHVRSCIEQDHTAVFVEVSPKPYTHDIWQTFTQMQKRFDCTN